MSEHEETQPAHEPRAHLTPDNLDSARVGGALWQLPLSVATTPHPNGLRVAAEFDDTLAREIDDPEHGPGLSRPLSGFVVYPSAPLSETQAGERLAALRTGLFEAAREGYRAALEQAPDAETQRIIEHSYYLTDKGEKVPVTPEVMRRRMAAQDGGAAAYGYLLDALGISGEAPPAEPERLAALLLGGSLSTYLAPPGSDFGIIFTPPDEGKRPAKRRPQGPAAVGTYPELAVLGFAAADARTGANWTEAPGGGALVHTRKKAGLQVRFAPAVGGDRWTDPAPGALSTDLYAILAANGGLDTVCLCQVVQDLAVNHEHEDVSLDDLGRLIGEDPRSTKEREAMRRRLWERLKFLDGLTVWGVRKGTYRDPVTRAKVAIESRDALVHIGGTMWPEQGTLDGSDVPLFVSFAAGPLLAQFRGRPDVLQTYGEFRPLAAIPRRKPSGAWAFAIGLALTQRWRELASYGRAQKLTRRYLLTQFPPSPSVDEVLADTKHITRARTYFTQALALLKTAGVIAAYAEPDPKTLPRTGWAKVWLGQTIDVSPPAAALAASQNLQAAREEAAGKATKGRKRPRKTTD